MLSNLCSSSTLSKLWLSLTLCLDCIQQEISARDKVFVPWLEANNAQVTPDPKECTHLVLTRVKTSSKFLVTLELTASMHETAEINELR